MSELNQLFRHRIGLAEEEQITFESLNHVLEKTAKTIPFENLSIIENRIGPISRESLIIKMLTGKKEGGLCYELNTLLYYFLIENGFKVNLTIGVVFDQNIQQFVPIGRTHVTILLDHENHTYIVDTGFGLNLPLKPVPLSGGTISSETGDFRIRKEESEFGDCVLEMKRVREHDSAWKTGYVFDSKLRVADMSEVDRVQSIVAYDPRSTFNKKRLITKLTDQGSVTLTESSMTVWDQGIMTKQEIDSNRFKELLERQFGL